MEDLDCLEKIENKLLFFNGFGNATLTISNLVTLGSKNRQGSKISFVNFKEYPSKKYLNKSKLVSCNLETNDFISLNYYGGQAERSEILLSYPHLPSFKRKLKVVKDLLENNVLEDDGTEINLFVQNSTGEYFLHPSAAEIEIKCSNLVNDKSIVFGFDVLYHPKEEKDVPSIIMWMNDPNYGIPLTIDEFYILYDLLYTFDLNLNSKVNLNTALLLI